MGLAIVAGAILLLSVVVFKRYLPYVGDRFQVKEQPAIVLAMEDAYLVGLGKKEKRWSLRARRVEIGRNRSVVTLTDIFDGNIFDDGEVALEVSAGKAVYDERRDDLQLSGGVSVEGRNGEKVTAKGARWDGSTSLLHGRGRARLEGEWGDASGDGLVVDVKQKEMTMTNVSGSVRIEQIERREAQTNAP